LGPVAWEWSDDDLKKINKYFYEKQLKEKLFLYQLFHVSLQR